MVDVEVDDRDAVQAVGGDRVRGTDRHAVEDAKAHRASALRVVARGPHRAKGGAAFVAHDEIDGKHRRARRMPRGVERMRVERGVGSMKCSPDSGLDASTSRM